MTFFCSLGKNNSTILVNFLYGRGSGNSGDSHRQKRKRRTEQHASHCVCGLIVFCIEHCAFPSTVFLLTWPRTNMTVEKGRSMPCVLGALPSAHWLEVPQQYPTTKEHPRQLEKAAGRTLSLWESRREAGGRRLHGDSGGVQQLGKGREGGRAGAERRRRPGNTCLGGVPFPSQAFPGMEKEYLSLSLSLSPPLLSPLKSEKEKAGRNSWQAGGRWACLWTVSCRSGISTSCFCRTLPVSLTGRQAGGVPAYPNMCCSSDGNLCSAPRLVHSEHSFLSFPNTSQTGSSRRIPFFLFPGKIKNYHEKEKTGWANNSKNLEWKGMVWQRKTLTFVEHSTFPRHSRHALG